MSGDFWKIEFNGKDIIYIRNTTKFYPITYDSVINYTSDDNSIIAVVDGDDRLSNSKAVNRISYVYMEK
jgi:hypothetical protein